LEAGAKVTVIASMLSEAIERLVADGSVDAIRRDYLPGDLAGARLVIDASDDVAINRQSWEEAEASGILINVVDRPAQCRFIAPAIVRRDPLLIAISTSGESPFLASSMRARLERWKARELLADADYVLHDALISPDTLALCGPDVRLERVGKRGGQEGAQQEDITARLIELARAGHFVVRLKGGDPFVFGRGGEELAQ